MQVIESAENYALAEVPRRIEGPAGRARVRLPYYDDKRFWDAVLQGGPRAWDARVDVPFDLAFSEWVARVPGLYWSPESAALRKYSPDAIEGHDLGGITLRPFGKSRVVSGGVGTIKLPPNAEGYRLGTVTLSANVSVGVPVLVAPEVWEECGLREGAVLRANPVSWKPMPYDWASRFPSTRAIPRGCLVLDSPTQVHVSAYETAGTQIHPFSIMEYTDGTTELFDFVFATGITTDSRYRAKLEAFFDDYKDREGRQGRYLIAADVATPLWDALYASPIELQRADPAAESHLKLLERRVLEATLGQRTMTTLLRALSSLPDIDHLRRAAARAGIPSALWLTGGTLADQSAQLLARASQQQVQSLIQALAIDYPEVLEVA